MRTATTRAAVHPTPSVEAPSGCGPGEIGIVVVVSAVLFAALIWTAAAESLFTRHFWLDEYLTALIVTDPELSHALAAVRGGVDTNPPVYHLMLRAFHAMVGGRAEVTFRAFAALCTWLALIVTYAVLRRSFAAAPAALAALALVAHRLILKESVEARFYAPLLPAVAGFVFFFCQGGTRSPRGGWGRDVLVALTAALTCTLHYFGIFAWSAVVAGEWLVSGGGRAFLRRLPPSAAGPVALLATIPFLRGQRFGLSVPTWMPDVTLGQLGQITTFLESVFYALPLVIVLAAWWGSQLRARRGETVNESARLAPVAGLAALAAVPFLVLCFSLAVQPALAPKYAIAGALSLAPLTALLARPLRPAMSGVVAAVIVALAFCHVSDLTGISWDRHQAINIRVARFQTPGDARPIVSISREGAYLLQYVDPNLAGRVNLVDLRPLREGSADKLYRYEVDMAHKVRRFYPVPRVIDVPTLRAMGPFHFDGTMVEFTQLRQQAPLREAGAGLWEAE